MGTRDCGNQRFFRRQQASVEVRDSLIHGKGVFLRKKGRKDELLLEYLGELHSELSLAARPVATRSNKFVMMAWKGIYIDAGRFGNESRFINHACVPNCEARTWLVSGFPRVGLFAKGAIAAGAELTCGSVVEGPCNCGSVKCLKTLPLGSSQAVPCLTPSLLASERAVVEDVSDELFDTPPQPSRAKRRKSVGRLRHPVGNPDLHTFMGGHYAPASQRPRGGQTGRNAGRSGPGAPVPPPVDPTRPGGRGSGRPSWQTSESMQRS